MEGTADRRESREKRCGRADGGETEPCMAASGSTTRSALGATIAEGSDEGKEKSEEDAVGATGDAGTACIANWRRARRRLRRPMVGRVRG